MTDYYYKFTFEDGSEAFAHYGVKGMKWGKHLKAFDPEYLLSLGIGGAQNIGAAVEAGAAAAQDMVEDTLENVQKTAEEIAKEAERQKQRLTEHFLGPRQYDPSTGHPVDTDENVAYAKRHSDIIKIKDRNMSPDDDMRSVNKNYKYGVDDSNRGRTQFVNSLINCATCSMVYDMRRRGYDVDANMTTNAAYTVSDIPSFYKGAKRVTVPGSSLDAADMMLKRHPDGARGMLSGVTVNGGGHAIAWEKESGNIVYRDCQTGTRYNNVNELRSLMSEDLSRRTGHSISYYRLDNCEMNLPKIYQQGIISKSGPEYTYGQQKNDMTRNAAGQGAQQYRIAKETADYYNNATLVTRLLKPVKVKDPVKLVADSVNNTINANKAYDEESKREKQPKARSELANRYFN